jgi:uncharacterized delta-60 repeat protein
LDTNFNAGVDKSVNLASVQPDGRIVVGGFYVAPPGQLRGFVQRLNPSGSLDVSFTPQEADYSVTCLTLQADGKILVGGGFTNLAGQPHPCLGRLNSDGTPDANFSPIAFGNATGLPGGPGPFVNSLALQADGKILVVGAFTSLAGRSQQSIARFQNTDPATQSLTFDGSTITWLRGGTSPEVYRTTFEASHDGVHWFSLGSGIRITGGWELSGVSFPAGSAIRARGFINERGRSSLVESFSGPSVLVNDSSLGFGSNQFKFTINAALGQTVVVEGSVDLVNWLPLATNTSAGGQLYFTDPNSTSLSRRAYRASYH